MIDITASPRLRVPASFLILALICVPLVAQESSWDWNVRGEVRANFRDSTSSRFALRFPFLPSELPPGETSGFAETVDAGSNAELSLASVTLDLTSGTFFGGRLKIDAVDLYDRNPTSDDREIDVDEWWLRFGQKPEGLDLPDGTSLFLQVGKAPKMERQPVRLLESYGVTSTAFNRFEDVQVLAGGSVGRNLYWRAQVSNGNPVFFRDANALAGDNGISELLQPNPDPELKSGFPILYDAEVEGYFFDTSEMEVGAGLGYRWNRSAGDGGFDALLFHYQRDLADEVDIEGTFYGGDLDLLDGARGFSLPLEGRNRNESGARVYVEWSRLSVVAQAVRQTLAGLHRSGYELETGVSFPLSLGPLTSIQPAVRGSYLVNHFRGPREFPSPSVWWDWAKVDAGLRITILENYDLTLEHAFHAVDSPVELDFDETLLTLRLRI